MKKQTDIKLEKTRAFFPVLNYLLSWFTHYKEKGGWLLNLSHLQLIDKKKLN